MPAPGLVWKEDGTPSSTQFDDIYYSSEYGAMESRHIFLAGNQLPERWNAPPAATREAPFVIAETGFGTGLNFLVTWDCWRQQPAAPRLHYLSVDRYPLDRDAMARALSRWPALGQLAEALLAQYPPPLPGAHRLCLDGGRVMLDLWWGDAQACLRDWEREGQARVDAWYLDGFTPARNGDLWTPALFRSMARLSRGDATLATFTVASTVRRDLQAAGFRVEKRAGFGRKREQLGGTPQCPPPATDFADTPWELPDLRMPPPGQVLVLGAGLAGSHCAASLARRGLQVEVLEAGQVAGGASGNAQGVLYTRLSHRHSPLVDFALASFTYASRLYRSLFDTGLLREGQDGALCGSLQFLEDGEVRPERFAIPGMAEWLDASQASQRAGLPLPGGACWWPDSGWLHPGAVCRALLSTPGVALREGLGALRLEAGGSGWQVRDAADRLVAEASCVVVAAGLQSRDLAELAWLPVKGIRGQTTQLPALPGLTPLRAVLCHEGYIAPAGPEGHCIGATFQVADDDPAARRADHRANLASLGRALPSLASALDALPLGALSGRVGWRCGTPDYLPLAGPVPDLPAFDQRYAPLRSNARQTIARPAPCLPGLYLSTGHGSRGLTSTPLCAELLASQICNEPLPLEPELQQALSPARFLIRDLARNRR